MPRREAQYSEHAEQDPGGKDPFIGMARSAAVRRDMNIRDERTQLIYARLVTESSRPDDVKGISET